MLPLFVGIGKPIQRDFWLCSDCCQGRRTYCSSEGLIIWLANFCFSCAPDEIVMTVKFYPFSFLNSGNSSFFARVSWHLEHICVESTDFCFSAEYSSLAHSPNPLEMLFRRIDQDLLVLSLAENCLHQTKEDEVCHFSVLPSWKTCYMNVPLEILFCISKYTVTHAWAINLLFSSKYPHILGYILKLGKYSLTPQYFLYNWHTNWWFRPSAFQSGKLSIL